MFLVFLLLIPLKSCPLSASKRLLACVLQSTPVNPCSHTGVMYNRRLIPAHCLDERLLKQVAHPSPPTSVPSLTHFPSLRNRRTAGSFPMKQDRSSVQTIGLHAINQHIYSKCSAIHALYVLIHALNTNYAAPLTDLPWRKFDWMLGNRLYTFLFCGAFNLINIYVSGPPSIIMYSHKKSKVEIALSEYEMRRTSL